jgi:hypothetical protein
MTSVAEMKTSTNEKKVVEKTEKAPKTKKETPAEEVPAGGEEASTETRQVEVFDKVAAAKQFKSDTNRICELIGSLAALAYKVGKHRSVTDENGAVKRKREVNGYCTSVKNAVRALNKPFMAALSPRRVRRNGNNVGFTYKTYITDELRDFFIGAEGEDSSVLGQVDPNDAKHGFLADKLSMIRDHGLSNQHILTMLSYIYIFVHNLQDPKDGRYITANDRMHKHFGDLFRRLNDEPDRYNDRGKLVAKIDPNRFMMASMQSLITANRVKNKDLTQEQTDFMNSDDVKEALFNEEKIISATMKIYRDNKKALKDAAKAAASK